MDPNFHVNIIAALLRRLGGTVELTEPKIMKNAVVFSRLDGCLLKLCLDDNPVKIPEGVNKVTMN